MQQLALPPVDPHRCRRRAVPPPGHTGPPPPPHTPLAAASPATSCSAPSVSRPHGCVFWGRGFGVFLFGGFSHHQTTDGRSLTCPPCMHAAVPARPHPSPPSAAPVVLPGSIPEHRLDRVRVSLSRSLVLSFVLSPSLSLFYSLSLRARYHYVPFDINLAMRFDQVRTGSVTVTGWSRMPPCTTSKDRSKINPMMANHSRGPDIDRKHSPHPINNR